MKNNEIPVLLIIFNRPDKVKKLVDSLEKIKPKHIYITADGPRENKPGEKDKCDETRKTATSIPWECEIHTNFSDVNLGCKKGVSTGVTWFFNNVEEGIVLEDDCLPNESFFSFCDQMLETYRDNQQVMHINGTSFLPTLNIKYDDVYYFSSITHSWGWASWRRAWQHYDGEMKNIDALKNKFKTDPIFTKNKCSRYWIKLFRHTINNKRDSWAVPWAFSVMYKNGVCITPSVNLVENIGFDEEATHTKGNLEFDLKPTTISEIPTKGKEIILNKTFDTKITEEIFMKSFKERIIMLLERWYNRLTK